jgi:sugar phosphate isomerase/epimerase
MRLGGPLFDDCSSPELWLKAMRASGYTAAYCPVADSASDATIGEYFHAACEADIVIAEVGAWSNPLSPDEEARKEALDLCKRRLALAEKAGARCCVNISGSRGEPWDGPHPDNLMPETFDLIVETTRDIIDSVRPERAFFTLETMPWMYPDSVDSYVRLLEAINRKQFAVHFDPVNLVCSPQRYYSTGELIRDFCAKLGPHIKSCHAKDILLHTKLTVHLDEARPGTGGLDYATYLRELDKLDPDLPLMLEHLPNREEYDLAAGHIRKVADEIGVKFR